MEESGAIKIAKGKKSTPDQLKGLLGISDEIDLLLAKHPNATAEMLDDICMRQSFDDKICGAALAHPNISPEQLLNVGYEYPMAMFRNPALPSIMQSRKNFLGEFTGEALEESFKKDIPLFVVDWLLSHGKAEYQVIFISAPKRTPEILEKFRSSKYSKVVATLLDKDANTYLAWATDLGLDTAAIAQLSAAEIRLNIDAWVGWLVGKKPDASDGAAAAMERSVSLPKDLGNALTSIEDMYFKGGRVPVGKSPNFYDEFSRLLEDTFKADAAFSKLVMKVIDFDLGEIKRFGNPGKKAPADIAKASYYVRSGLERSFIRLAAAIAIWFAKQPEDRRMALNNTLSKLVLDHPMPNVPESAAIAGNHAQDQNSRQAEIAIRPLEQDEAAYLAWATDLGFTRPTYDDGETTSLKSEIDDWVEALWSQNQELHKALVPAKGCAPSLQGELVRALGRIEAEHFRNGMTNWGDGSGFYEGFTSLIHDTLKSEITFSKLVKKTIAADIGEIKKSGQIGKAIASGKKPRDAAFGGNVLIQCDVEKSHQRLGALITLWCQRHPEPWPYIGKD